MKALPRPPRTLLSACALSLVLLSGCDDAVEPLHSHDAGTRPSAGDSGTDAGPEGWDGTYTELEEHGEWQDRGRFAPCSFNSAGTAVSCTDLSRFDQSRCSPDALAALPQEGIYLADVRGESRLSDGGVRVTGNSTSFLLRSDGGTGLVNGQPALIRQTDGGTFFLAGNRTSPFTGTTTTALVGCQVPSPGIITGCFARCTNGRFRQTGTFEAHRMTWRPGDSESSGGLRLLSESPVPLGLPVDVYVARGHAYVVSLSRGDTPGGLTVFDVSDREHPVLKATISLPGDPSWNGVWARDNALYVAGGTGVAVYNISNPASPDFVRTLTGLGATAISIHTVLVDGDRLYAMAPVGQTLVYDVSTPLAPVLLQSIALPEQFSFGGPHDAFAYEGRLYISNAYGGYSVMDVTNLEDVRHLGQYTYTDGFAHHSQVGTFAGRTIAFEGGEFPASHLRVLDVTHPDRIVKIGGLRMRPVTSIHNMILKGTLLYVAWYHEGLRVLDVSNPTQPREVAYFNTFRETDPGRSDGVFEGAIGIRVPGDGSVYVVDSARGLLVLNELP